VTYLGGRPRRLGAKLPRSNCDGLVEEWDIGGIILGFELIPGDWAWGFDGRFVRLGIRSGWVKPSNCCLSNEEFTAARLSVSFDADDIINCCVISHKSCWCCCCIAKGVDSCDDDVSDVFCRLTAGGEENDDEGDILCLTNCCWEFNWIVLVRSVNNVEGSDNLDEVYW